MSEDSVRHPITAVVLLGLSAVTTFINYSLIKNESKHSANPHSIGKGLVSNPVRKGLFIFMAPVMTVCVEYSPAA